MLTGTMTGMKYLVTGVLACAFATSLASQESAPAEAITTDSGATYTGKFAGVEGDNVLFDDAVAGRIKVPTARISSFDALFAGGSKDLYYTTAKHDDAIKQGSMRAVDGTIRAFDADGNDLGKAGDLYKTDLSPFSLWNFKGNVSSALTYSDGNTQEVGYGLYTRMDWTHPLHRIGAEGEALYGERNGTRSTQRARAMGDYAFFFSGDIGALFREEIEHDDFKNVEWQSVTTIGLTTTLVEKPKVYSLDAEAGLTYTMIRYDRGGAEDDYAGAMAAIIIVWDPRDGVNFRFSSRLNVSLEDTEDSTLQTRAGLTLDLGDGFAFGARLEHDYDNLPAPGVERNDTRLIFLLTYVF